MIHGTTSSGFEFSFEHSVLDDMRLVDEMTVMMTPGVHPSALLAANSAAAELVLGNAQKSALYEHIGKQNEGRVPTAVFARELNEIISSVGKDAEKN